MKRISASQPGAFDSQRLAGKVLVVCLCTEVIILLLDLLINFFQLIDDVSVQHMFNIAREQSIGTWFSVVQSAFTGLVLLAIYFFSAEQKRVLGWLALGFFFCTSPSMMPQRFMSGWATWCRMKVPNPKGHCLAL